jgi:haloacetate dehalogenase
MIAGNNLGDIEGFDRHRLPGHGITVDVLVGGSGPALLLLLLLHGAPETRVCWRAIAPGLAERFTVVVPDLRGYGRSDKPSGGGNHEAFSKRIMALDQVALMDSLGFGNFSVAGHDRGGRVAYRLALDHPRKVNQLAVLDIVPTSDAMEMFDRHSGLRLWHWAFQALPEPVPETLISNDPEFYVHTMLRSHAAESFAFDERSVAGYTCCLREYAAIHAMCEDYRAAWTYDRELDEQDKGRLFISATLVLWGEQTPAARSPLDRWRAWAKDLRGHPLRCGHFLPEEKPTEVLNYFNDFFS